MIANEAGKHSQAFHNEVVARVIHALRNRLDESFTLSTIAAVAFISRFHFNRVFRQVTGIPPCQFFYAMRLAEAKLLLLTTRLKVIDICYNVGYQSLGTFTRRFTELVGVSPSRFRSQARYWKERPIIMPQHAINDPSSSDGPALYGTISAPAEFKGAIFIGLFEEPIPQGKPSTCTVLGESGSFHMTGLQEGTFYLFALALPAPMDAASLFHSPNAWRAGGQPITVAHSAVRGTTELVLRPPEVFDPPILAAIPPFLPEPLGREFLGESPETFMIYEDSDREVAWTAKSSDGVPLSR